MQTCSKWATLPCADRGLGCHLLVSVWDAIVGLGQARVPKCSMSGIVGLASATIAGGCINSLCRWRQPSRGCLDPCRTLWTLCASVGTEGSGGTAEGACSATACLGVILLQKAMTLYKNSVCTALLSWRACMLVLKRRAISKLGCQNQLQHSEAWSDSLSVFFFSCCVPLLLVTRSRARCFLARSW